MTNRLSMRDALSLRTLLTTCFTFAFMSLLLTNVQAEKTVELFNGKDLSGWQMASSKAENKPDYSEWKSEDGMIVGENPSTHGSILWSEKKFKNFELTLDFMTPLPTADSGIFIRAKSHQIQIGVSYYVKKDLTAAIYCPQDKYKVNGELRKYPLHPLSAVKMAHKPNKWNTMKIRVEGKDVKTHLNGKPVLVYTSSTIPDEGPIGLQLHDFMHMKISFKNIKVKVLD